MICRTSLLSTFSALVIIVAGGGIAQALPLAQAQTSPLTQTTAVVVPQKSCPKGTPSYRDGALAALQDIVRKPELLSGVKILDSVHLSFLPEESDDVLADGSRKMEVLKAVPSLYPRALSRIYTLQPNETCSGYSIESVNEDGVELESSLSLRSVIPSIATERGIGESAGPVACDANFFDRARANQAALDYLITNEPQLMPAKIQDEKTLSGESLTLHPVETCGNPASVGDPSSVSLNIVRHTLPEGSPDRVFSFELKPAKDCTHYQVLHYHASSKGDLLNLCRR